MDQGILRDIYAKRCQLAIATLKANGFEVIYADNSQEALEKTLSFIPKDATVGIGGSVTVREIGLVEALERQGNTIFADWGKPLELEEKLRKRRAGLTSDVYLTSSNAITLHGQLVNIDGTGNRVSAMIRNIAGPLNGRRLNLKTPCALTGQCNNCDSPDRMCKVSVVIEKRPALSDITIILVGESLGY